MGTMRCTIVLILIVLNRNTEWVTGTKSMDHERWLSRFKSEAAQTFLRSLAGCPKDAVLFLRGTQTKKDEIALYPGHPTVSTDVRSFPISKRTTRMMFAIFGDEGAFRKDGFRRLGMISAEGPAQVIAWKIFANKTEVLQKLRQSKTDAIGSGVFSVLTQLLFLPEDIKKLEDWLVESINKGDEESEEHCVPKVVIRYKCCEETADPRLAPEFGSIDMAIN